MDGKSKYSLKKLIFFSIILFSLALMQWGCGQIPEEGTIVYDVDFPPADSDEAQGGGAGGGSGGSTPQNIILNASKTTLNELGSDTLTISATSDATSTTNIIVNISYGGTATRGSGSDYTASSDNLTILAGSTTSNSITITSLDDGIYDDGETIVVDISSVSGGDSAVESGTQQKTIVFSDDELPPAVTPPVVSISASADSITEDSGGTITITVEQDVVASIATTVTLALTGTATNTTDYNLSSTTATIAAGTLQDNLTLTPTTDSITEDNETILISIASVSGGDNASEDGVQIAEVTITDDEPLRTVTLGFDTTSVNENAGSGAITITATQSGQAQADTIVNLGVSGAALASGTDYTLNSSFITIAGGTTTGTTTIDTVNDVIDEGDNETFALEISSVTGGNGASESGTQSVTAMILDNDVAGFTQVGPTDPVGEYYGTPLYLNEGDNETFTIVLNTQPQGTVYFDIGGSAANAACDGNYYTCYALADGSQILTFDETNWNIAQSVVTLAKDDNRKRSDQRKYTYINPSASSTDPYYAALSPDVRNYIFVDTDTVGVTVSKTTSTINESGAGSTDTFTVGLDTVPLYQTYLSVTSDNTSEVTVSPSSLAYHSSYPFGFTRTVTVTGVSDDIDDGDQTVNVSIAVNTGLTSDQFYDNYTTVRTVAVTISDVDTAAFTVTESGGVSSVSESGTTDTFEVALLTKPRSGNVVIDLTSADPAEVTVSPASVTFGSGNWSTAQVITLTGQPDSAADGDQTVSITASVNDPATGDTIYDGLADQSFNVTVTNIDSAFFTVADTGGSTAVSEPNTTDTFTVVLGTLPSSNVVIDVTSADVNEAMLSTNQLTFTTGDWNTPQTVTVTAADDSIQDGNQFTVITIDVNDGLTADPTYTALANQTFTVTTADDDAAGYTITESGGSTSLNESGTTDTFTVVLNTEPSGDVVFTITSENTAEATVTSSLTFTTGNWNTAQTVTVTGVDDDEDDGDTNNTITVAINTASTADSNYDVLANQTVTATVVDDDTVGFTLTQSGGSTSVSEDGTRDDISVVLNSQPNTTVRITFTSSDTSQATVSNAFYTFDASNWDTPKSFRVLAVADQIDDGDATITVAAAIDNGTTDDAKYKALAAQTVTGITVTDIDTAAYTVTESGGDSTVSETGTTDTFEVVLATKPTGNVVFNLSNPTPTEVSLSTSSLTFTTSDWDTAQTVTMTGVDDVASDGDVTTTITISVNTGSTADTVYDALGSQTVVVTTTDDDSAGITITATGGSTAVSETGTTDTFTVVLNTLPTSSVVIDISSADSTETSISPSTLTFTTGDWNTAQTVTVTGVDDDLDDGNQASNVLVDVNNGSTSDGNYSGLATINVGVTTTDDDTSNFTITETAGTSVAESGTTDTFTVVLNAQPTGNVAFAISSDDTGEATVTSSLTFTTGDWNTAQTVTVTGVNDSEDDGNQTPAVTVAINTGSTNDSIYDAVADQTVSVTVTDDDSAGFTVTETGGTSVSESGTSDTFTVVLDSQPNTRVRFNLTSGDTNEVLVSPAAITFDDTNWNVAQTVTVSGTTDNEDDGDQTIAVTVAVETTYTNDANFDLLGSKSVNVNVTDIDTVGFTITESAGSTTVSETGTSDTYTIVLNTLPTGDVVFNLSSVDAGEVTASPANLTFTTGNWNSEQTVTVTGQSDSSQDGDQTIAVTAAINTGATADTQYDGVSPQNVSVTITDVDTASYTITQPASSVSETGTTTTFTVVLDLLPTANVTIDLASNDTGEATVSPSSLTFTTGDYNTAQTVTIRGVDDDVDDNNQNISVSVDPNNGSADSAYGALATQLAYVTVADDDDAGFSLGSTAGLSVNESGTTDTFTVVLDTAPTADVVFEITSENTAEATVSSSLTFTSANWNTPQSVTITGVDDPLDDNDQTVSITVAINTTSTLDVLYDALASQSTNVTVVDDEVAPTVTLSADTTTVVEDTGTITLTATQLFATANNTTVTLTGTGGTASGSDYSVGTITILAGDTTGSTTFTPDRDSRVEADETAIIEITAVSSADGAIEDGTQSVTLTITNDDTAELKYSHIGGSTSVTEGGSTDSLTLYLGSEPSGNVVVDITYTEQSQVEVTTPSSLQLTFTPTNYMNVQVITLRAIDDDFIDGNHTSTVTISVNAGLTADSNYDVLSSKNKTVSIIDDDTSGIADFTIDSIDRDYGRLALNWTAPTGIVNDGDTTSAGGSDDYYRVYWTTVAPGARTPANRDIDQTDNATRTIDGDRIIFVHGGLNSATYYYYRLAVYDTSTGAWKFSTNELGASPLPVECTSTGGTSEITDNDPDLLVYYPLNNDLQDYSPQGSRTGAEGWPYHLAEDSSDSDIDFGEGCAYGNSGYMSGAGAYDGTRGNGTWGVNNDFSNADFPANDGNWTVSVWTSPDGDLEKFTSVFSTGDNNKGPELQLDVDDQYEPIGRIRLFNKMSDNLKGQRLQQSTWYHVVVVHRANDSIDLYVNNVLKATKTSWPYTSGSSLQWDKIKIGQNRYRDANYKGYIDEFKIYGRAFTASEVANLYNFTLPPAVENINVSGQGGSTLRLTWDEVDGAIDYTIFQAEKSSSGLTNVITFTNPNLDTSTDPDLSAISGITSCTSGSCSYDVTGLTNNKYYYYRIAARNGRGSGQVSPNSEVSAQCCSP